MSVYSNIHDKAEYNEFVEAHSLELVYEYAYANGRTISVYSTFCILQLEHEKLLFTYRHKQLAFKYIHSIDKQDTAQQVLI